MYTLALCIAAFIILIVIVILTKDSYEYDFLWVLSSILAAIFFVALFIMGIYIASKNDSAKVSIAKFEAIRTTIEEQRKGAGTELERVEMTKTIIENNTWLADQKASYYNPWESVFCSDQYFKVEPLK